MRERAIKFCVKKNISMMVIHTYNTHFFVKQLLSITPTAEHLRIFILRMWRHPPSKYQANGLFLVIAFARRWTCILQLSEEYAIHLFLGSSDYVRNYAHFLVAYICTMCKLQCINKHDL